MSDEQGKAGIHIGGGVSGGNVNIGGTQTFGAGTTIGFTMGAAAAGDDKFAELKKLYEELAAALKEIPATQQEQIAAVQQLAQSALDEAQKPKPSKPVLQVTGEGLKKAAENLLGVVPIVAQIAAKLLLIG